MIIAASIVPFILVYGSILLDLMVFLPALTLLLFLLVNYLPLRLLKSNGLQTDFFNTFLLLGLFNTSLFLPVIINELITSSFDISSVLGSLLLLCIVYLVALAGALIHIPLSKTPQADLDTPIYQSRDILLQTPSASQDHEQALPLIPLGNSNGKSLAFKLVVWTLAIIMVVIPLYATVENNLTGFWPFTF